ncbi:phosphoglycerate mutase [Christiangramia fulva]|uniref:Phosphoglycerate mutase n=1 Tax=Christiangramia fulva TaxID=2126553 RepID=A0A2R3Z6E5_9FLAO|nr:histidine phosphatase family protein [Christiangramia fulva]AVR45830.1 phosphoglycerate mutase [Christiangramia fulva]
MNSILILFSSIVLSLFTNPQKDAIKPTPGTVTTYYLIRHAEKNGNVMTGNPDLTEKGLKRAENWAKVFKDVDFDAVYSTDFIRTIKTATPTAKAQNLEVKLYDPKNLYSDDFQKATNGKTVLVVGHSNTTPKLANAILKNKKYQDLDETEFGALFIVEIFEDGTQTSKVLYIN